MSRMRLALCLLLAGAAIPARAEQAQEPPAPGPESDAAEAGDGPLIVVIGIPEALRGVPPVRSFDEEDIAGYGLGTVEDFLAEIGAELGDDDEPVVLVNGERIDDLDEIAGYPVEALRRVDVLPRGSSTRVGGPPGRRVYSLVLRRQVRSATLTAASRFATEGEWTAPRGEAIITRIQGPNRINLSLRVRDEGDLLESERGIVQPAGRQPFDLRGNIVADPRGAGSEIDPQLSALAGTLVTVAGVPAGPNPTLAEFGARANDPNLTDLGDFRTLRPTTRSYEVGLSANQRLAPWLSASFNGRLNHSVSDSLLGLPRGLFLLPASNAFSPFSRDVGLAAFGGATPLEQRFRILRGNANLALNGQIGRWRGALSAGYQTFETRSEVQRPDVAGLGGAILLPDLRNPFAGGLADLLPVATDRADSETRNLNLQARATGPLLDLPAGPALATLEARLARFELDSRSEFLGDVTARRLERGERALRGAVELPLASRRNGFLPKLGELSAVFDHALLDFSDAGTLEQSSYGLIWSPLERIRLHASVSHVRRPPEIQALGDPLVVTPAIRTFDYLTGETVDATWITGGNPALLPERTRIERLALTLRPMPSINLLLNAEYSGTRTRNSVSALPPASLPILLAFPDRFVPDLDGVLTLVDVRPVNFARAVENRLRYGLSFGLPIGGSATRAPAPATAEAEAPDVGGDDPAPAPLAAADGPRPRLLVSANHTIVLDNEILIRPGLPAVDLLDGGAVGVAGGRNRHLLDFAVGVSDRGLGLRFGGNWRSATGVDARIGGTPDRLRFAPLATFGLRAFADAQRLFPRTPSLRGMRLSLTVANLTNERQRVTDASGATPLQYQPAYRDPLGRTVELEIRKVF